MKNFDSEINYLSKEISALKIFKNKTASQLKMNKQFFTVDFVLNWDNTYDKPVSDWVYLDADVNNDNIPLASIALEEDDLQDRQVRSYTWSSRGIEFLQWPTRFCMMIQVVSDNSSDISATQGGGTKTITLNFSITGTANFDIVPGRQL